METESTQSILEEFTRPNVRRRQLLPWWIRSFCLLFMLAVVAGVFCLVYGLFGGRPSLSIYGFTTNDVFSITGIVILIVFFLKGFAAFALWFEKDYAIKIGLADAILGIVLCLVNMLVFPFFKQPFFVQFRLELVLLIPYLLRLIKIKDVWAQATILS